MKAVCDTTTLTHWVQMASAVASPRSPKPALGCIKIDADSEGVSLLATDLEVGFQARTNKADVQDGGQALVPADRFSQILREIDADQVTLTSDGSETELTAPGVRFKVLGDNPEDFPEVPTGDGEGAFTVAADDLEGMIERTIFATAKEHTRYALNGVLWEVEGSTLNLVATEGHRLSLVGGKCEGGPEEKTTAIVPAKAMQLVARCLGDVDDPNAKVSVHVGERDIIVTAPPQEQGQWTVYSRLVDGHFPKYEDLIPDGMEHKVALGRDAFHGAVRKAALLTNEESRGVRMAFEAGKLTISSKSPEMGEAEIVLEVDYDAEPAEIGFNPQYLTDALKVVDADEVQFAFKGPNKPGVMTEGRTFTYLVMPVTIL